MQRNQFFLLIYIFALRTIRATTNGITMKHILALLLFLSPFIAAQSIDEFIKQADHYSLVTFEREKSLEKLFSAEKIDPKNYEILWRISRSFIDIGEHMPNKTDADKEKQLNYYQRSLEYAEKSIAVNPNDSKGYIRRAIANGRVALFKGVWSAIDYVKQVKADCEKAIALDPKNDVAYYILARTHAKLCEKSRWIRVPLGLGWANMQDAIANYEMAISLKNNFIMYRLDAARAYIEKNNLTKAKEYLSAISTYPKQDEDDDVYRGEAKELLEKIISEK